MNEVEELTKNASGWLHQLINSNQVTISGDQAENMVAAKQWLAQINQGQLLVTEAPKPPQLEVVPAPPEGDAQPGAIGETPLDTVPDAGAQE